LFVLIFQASKIIEKIKSCKKIIANDLR